MSCLAESGRRLRCAGLAGISRPSKLRPTGELRRRDRTFSPASLSPEPCSRNMAMSTFGRHTWCGSTLLGATPWTVSIGGHASVTDSVVVTELRYPAWQALSGFPPATPTSCVQLGLAFPTLAGIATACHAHNPADSAGRPLLHRLHACRTGPAGMGAGSA